MNNEGLNENKKKKKKKKRTIQDIEDITRLSQGIIDQLLDVYKQGKIIAVISVVAGLILVVLVIVMLLPVINPPPYQFITMALVAVALFIAGCVAYVLVIRRVADRQEEISGKIGKAFEELSKTLREHFGSKKNNYV